MKKRIHFSVIFVLIVSIFYLITKGEKNLDVRNFKFSKVIKNEKKSINEKMLFVQERLEYELNLQKNPKTGKIPYQEKVDELRASLRAKEKKLTTRNQSNRVYVSRGPANLGGRTRDLVIDLSDETGNTIISGGVSSGVFRTTDGGASWTKVSANDEIHNVTTIVQDPRPTFQNVWYYATGEGIGNSASNRGDFFFGQGVWKSTDNGLSWSQIPETNSVFGNFDSRLDIITALEVSPITGDLFIAAANRIYRYDGVLLTIELDNSGANTQSLTDVAVNNLGRVYAAFRGINSTQSGIWTSPTGIGNWTQIAENGDPSGWDARGRIVLATAPSNDDVLYALFDNSGVNTSGEVEADLWKYNLSTDSWSDFTSRMPDEPGGDLAGNDPFSIQGGYDLVVSVKPDNENFLVIAGTNAYISSNINTTNFTRIGGYRDNTTYALYDIGGVDHHPDIHAMEFDPFDYNMLYTGTDGGVHRTNISSSPIIWENLNNDYLTYQYYFVALDDVTGGNIVIGGAQDNGTTIGGTNIGQPNNSDMSLFFGGDGVSVGIARRENKSEVQFYFGSQRGNMRTNYPNSRTIAPSDANLSNGAGLFVTYFYLDPDNTETIYYVLDNTLYRSNDAINVTRDSWENLGGVFTLENIRLLSATRGDYNENSSYLMIGGNNGGIFRVNNPHNVPPSSLGSNAIARRITPPGASTESGSIVTGIAIHPTNPDIVLVSYSNYGITNLFLTNNATATSPNWIEVERNLDSHSIRTAVIAEVDGEAIYFVGTARGLYSSIDPLTRDWELEGPETIGLAVVSDLDYRPSDNKLLVGTHGNGMFETTVVKNTLSNSDSAEINPFDLKIYPNPANDKINLSSSKIDFNSEFSYRISDLSGRIIQKGTIKDKSIDIMALQSGVYILKLKNKNKTGSLKFIKK